MTKLKKNGWKRCMFNTLIPICAIVLIFVLASQYHLIILPNSPTLAQQESPPNGCLNLPLYQNAIHQNMAGMGGKFDAIFPTTYEGFARAVGNHTVYFGPFDVFIHPGNYLFSFPDQNEIPVAWKCN